LSAWPRIAAVGDSAVSVELGDSIDPALSARVRALDQSLLERPFGGFRESVPSYRALLVLYHPLVVSFADVRDELLQRLAAAAPAAAPGRLHVIPTHYAGDDGPDLQEVARALGLSEDAVVAQHAEGTYTAFMLGFMPGFAYLGVLPKALETPRRTTPRARVAAGSVAIAGRQTAIYPKASPGGWNLIGRTALRLFDPWADPPATIQPGDLVRFERVAALPEASAEEPAPTRMGTARAAIEVLESGLLTTVQDVGRWGHRRLGVGSAGPMDANSHGAANVVVGNPPGAAALECTVTGPTLRFIAATRFAIAGGDLGAVLHRADLGAWPVPLGEGVLARPGNVLAFTGRRAGCRAYVAFAGGLEVPKILGSRSTDLSGGFGGIDGRAVRAGDVLALGPPRGAPREAETGAALPQEGVTVRVVLGPQDGHFEKEVVARFLSEAYGVAALSDRVGCRLDGPVLAHRGAAEIVSDGMVQGSIQVPPDGRPIVMMADGPTTGGYPKIATVVSADLPLLAQLLPGDGRVRFTAVTVEEAQRALREVEPHA
jgi:KipI family sensor histidine kinase inhibitor